MNNLRAAVVVLSLGVAASAAAKPLPPETQRRARVAPDPRQGERLDGRAPYRDPYRYALVVPRAVLLLPRVFAYAILAPATEVTEYMEGTRTWAKIKAMLSSGDSLIGVRPTLHYESGFLPSVGLRWEDRRTLGLGTRMAASFRTAGLDLYKMTAALRPWTPPLEFRGEIEADPSAMFGGTNGESRDDLEAQGRDVARYSFDRYIAALVWEDRPADTFWYAIGAELLRTDYGNGDGRSGDPAIFDAFCTSPGTAACMSVDDTLVPGFNEGLRLASLNAGLDWDSRRHERFATGGLLRLSGRLAEGISGDPSRHAAGQVKVCGSVAFGERQLDLCGRAGLVEPLGDAEVPFDELMTPGGTDGLRAIPGGRLRGRSELLATIEHRWLLGAELDASVYFDYGGAFGPRFEDVSLGDMIPGVGFAIRYVRHDHRFYYWRARPAAGFQLAWAPDEGFRFMLSVTR